MKYMYALLFICGKFAESHTVNTTQSKYTEIGNLPKYLKRVWTNSEDPDQTAHEGAV